jgi:NAD(P)-dependent dehydrogenase (short-subunit alcohol dehydrogenase family)
MLTVVKELEDIADVIAFLASDEARYIAGECIEISGAKAVYYILGFF